MEQYYSYWSQLHVIMICNLVWNMSIKLIQYQNIHSSVQTNNFQYVLLYSEVLFLSGHKYMQHASYLDKKIMFKHIYEY